MVKVNKQYYYWENMNTQIQSNTHFYTYFYTSLFNSFRFLSCNSCKLHSEWLLRLLIHLLIHLVSPKFFLQALASKQVLDCLFIRKQLNKQTKTVCQFTVNTYKDCLSLKSLNISLSTMYTNQNNTLMIKSAKNLNNFWWFNQLSSWIQKWL